MKLWGEEDNESECEGSLHFSRTSGTHAQTSAACQVALVTSVCPLVRESVSSLRSCG